MFTVKEIIHSIKKRRKELFLTSGKLPVGECARIDKIVQQYAPHGHLWKSLLPTRHGDFLSHYAAVIGTRGRAGVLVQFSGQRPSDKEIVLGSVPDIHDVLQVSSVLRKSTERSGWKQEY